MSVPPDEPDEPDDRALLAAHVAGDERAFGMLFTRHRDRLWAVALRTTGHREDAADALQEAMISAFRRAGSFRGDAAVSTWLHRIVVNAALDRIRRRNVRAAQPLDEEDDRPAGPSDEPEASALAADTRQRVLAALAQLPAEQRAALVLVDMEAYPVSEVAAILQVPSGTVKSRCARGRARLASLLGELVDHPYGAPGTEVVAGASEPVTAGTGPEPAPHPAEDDGTDATRGGGR